MTDCCTPGSGFPSASSMEQLATNLPVVWEEICKIQQAVLAASSSQQMCTTVGGTTPMTFVAGVTGVTVTAGGTGYVQDTPHAVIIPPLGSSASGATATVTTTTGRITAINVTAAGTGYAPIPATLSVSGGSGANIQPLVNAAGQIVGVNIVSPGTGYTTSSTVTPTRAVAPNAAYTNASIIVTAVGGAGELVSFAILNAGSGYQSSVATVEIRSTLNTSTPYPLGVGFQASVIVASGLVTQVIVTNPGAGYATYSPYLVISDSGSGATTSVTLSGSAVASVAVLTSGSNYTQSATGTILNPTTATGPNPPSSPATVTIQVSNNTFGTTPSLYYQVWSNTATNKAIQMQLNTVLSYFQGLGYTISIITNPATGTTISWKICW